MIGKLKVCFSFSLSRLFVFLFDNSTIKIFKKMFPVYFIFKLFIVWNIKIHRVFFACLFEVFYTEVLESIRHGVADHVDPENIILEINASK